MPFACTVYTRVPLIPGQIHSPEWMALLLSAAILILVARTMSSNLRTMRIALRSSGLALGSVAIAWAVYPRRIRPLLSNCGFVGYEPYTEHDVHMIAISSVLTTILIMIPVVVKYRRRASMGGKA